jgi:hypothetical protein
MLKPKPHNPFSGSRLSIIGKLLLVIGTGGYAYSQSPHANIGDRVFQIISLVVLSGFGVLIFDRYTLTKSLQQAIIFAVKWVLLVVLLWLFFVGALLLCFLFWALIHTGLG